MVRKLNKKDLALIKKVVKKQQRIIDQMNEPIPYSELRKPMDI